MLKTTEHDISTSHKIIKDKDFLTLKLPDVLFILLINVKMPTVVGILIFMRNVKMPTVVGILIFMSRINAKSFFF